MWHNRAECHNAIRLSGLLQMAIEQFAHRVRPYQVGCVPGVQAANATAIGNTANAFVPENILVAQPGDDSAVVLPVRIERDRFRCDAGG